jgi:hypothetical protein
MSLFFENRARLAAAEAGWRARLAGVSFVLALTSPLDLAPHVRKRTRDRIAGDWLYGWGCADRLLEIHARRARLEAWRALPRVRLPVPAYSAPAEVLA